MDTSKGKTARPSPFSTETPMGHSIALVTGTTSGLGYAASSMLSPPRATAQVIITGRSLAEAQEAAAKLAAETKRQVFTPLELNLDSPSSVRSIRPRRAWSSGVSRSISCCSMQGWSQVRSAVLICGGRRGVSGPADRPSSTGRRVAPRQPAEPRRADCYRRLRNSARGGVPMFKYTDLPAFAAKYNQGDRTAAVEALIRNGPNIKVRAQQCVMPDAKLIIAWWACGAGAPATLRHGRVRGLARCVERHPGGAKRWSVVEVSDDSNREPHSRHESDAGDRGPPVPPGVGVRNRRLRAILRLGTRKVLRPN